MTLHAFTDGASRGNPGESGIGVVIKNENGDLLHTETRYLGRTTNNVAEYTALISLLDAVRGMTCSRLIVHSDSELMVRQVNGQYKVRNPELKRHHAHVLSLVREAPYSFELRHIPRENNAEADRLANAGIDGK
jgi:ribonuclease HI